MAIKPDSLNELDDEGIRVFIAHGELLLKQRDDDRKAKAMETARATLAAVGLTLKDLANGRAKNKPGKAPVYHAGHQYQHPTNKSLVWNAHGQKPNWLRDLEAQGQKAVEITA